MQGHIEFKPFVDFHYIKAEHDEKGKATFNVEINDYEPEIYADNQIAENIKNHPSIYSNLRWAFNFYGPRPE